MLNFGAELNFLELWILSLLELSQTKLCHFTICDYFWSAMICYEIPANVNHLALEVEEVYLV